jgi:hypothetical protein
LKSEQWLAAALLSAALLAGCGGGDGDNNSIEASAGAWSGTTDSGRDLTALVLRDGSYYLLYSAVGNADGVGGAVQGTGALAGGSFTSSDAVGFSAEGTGVSKGTFAGAIATWQSFAGTFTPTAGAPLSFQASYIPDGQLRPNTTQVLAGAYTGEAGFALGVRPATFTVTAEGAVSSSINGCPITGTATPHADSNAYDLTIVFGAAPCALPGFSFTGIAYVRPDNGRLYAVARNEATLQSVIFNGSRP